MARNLFAWKPGTGDGPAHKVLYGRLMRRLATRSVLRAARIVCVSSAIERELPTGARTEVIHHGCALLEDPAAAEERATSRIIEVVSLAGMEPHKRPDRVVDMVCALAERNVPVRLRIIGPASSRKAAMELRQRAHSKLGYDPYCGPVEYGRIASILSSAHVLAVGAVFESFCMPIVEAMRCGAIVWAPACLLTRELCGDVAVLFPADDSNFGARVMLYHLSVFPEKSAASSLRSHLYDWESTVRNTCRALAEVLDSRGMVR